MTTRRLCLALLAAGALSAAAPAFTAPAFAAPAFAAPAEAAMKRDHDAILGMVGDFKVRFDMRETVAMTPGYKLFEPKVAGGVEAVRVVEDRGDFIGLQHLLVVQDEGKTVVVKHWRQDWTYQPKTVLSYKSAGRWVTAPVSATERKGAWSQTVWQTDDSPRYGGVGRWAYDNGATRWVSNETLRPLARRDATRHPPYSWYVGQNRHVLTPAGWVHEQDNAKIGLVDGKPVTFAHEIVLNSYTRTAGLTQVQAADDYWAKTKDYWAAVRMAWAETERAKGGMSVREEASNGSMTGPRLMGLADDIAEGKTSTAAATTEARAAIAKETGLGPAS